MKRLNLSGIRFGRWTVMFLADVKYNKTFWMCKCECGTMRAVVGQSLVSGKTNSCGCIRNEKTIERNRASAKHNMSDTAEHGIWNGMRQRCSNPRNIQYPDYGGRGIRVCERWNTFVNFYSDMGPRPSLKHSLERKNNNGDYCKDNCYWATLEQQARNRRTTLYVTWNGVLETFVSVCERLKVNYVTALSRFNNGLPLELVFHNGDLRKMWLRGRDRPQRKL